MTRKTNAQIAAEINAQITTNGVGAITGAILNQVLSDVNDSKPNLNMAALNNIGTRTLDNLLGSIDNTVSNTYQISLTVNQPFDAIRVVFMNTNTNFGTYCLSCKASVVSATTDLNNSSGTWVQVLKNGLNNIPMPISPAVDRPSYQVSDWLPLKSLARTDGGTLPIVIIRGVFDQISTLTCYGSGTDSYTNWANKPDGNIWVSRQQAGDFVTTPTGFTSTTNTSQSPIIGVQYLCKGKIVNVAAVGDSIIGGRSTYIGEGFIQPAVETINATNAMSYANFGWAGQLSVTYTARAIDLLESPLRPDVMFFITGSPNDISTTIAATDIQSQSGRFQQIIAKCKEVGTIPVPCTWLPSNTAVKNYGATDSLRVAENTEVLSIYPYNSLDTSTVVSGSTSGGQVQYNPVDTTDGLHPNDAGNTALAAIVQPYLQGIL